MICYRDRTYCISPNCQNKCNAKLTDEIKREAIKWWFNSTYGEIGNVPIAMSEFCDDNGDPIKNENEEAINKRIDESIERCRPILEKLSKR